MWTEYVCESSCILGYSLLRLVVVCVSRTLLPFLLFFLLRFSFPWFGHLLHIQMPSHYLTSCVCVWRQHKRTADLQNKPNRTNESYKQNRNIFCFFFFFLSQPSDPICDYGAHSFNLNFHFFRFSLFCSLEHIAHVFMRACDNTSSNYNICDNQLRTISYGWYDYTYDIPTIRVFDCSHNFCTWNMSFWRVHRHWHLHQSQTHWILSALICSGTAAANDHLIASRAHKWAETKAKKRRERGQQRKRRRQEEKKN